MSLRVFYYDDVDGDGDQELTTTTADILTATDYAAAIDADAANLSIGTPPLPPEANASGIEAAYQRVAQDAVRRGTLVVVSADNSDADLQRGGFFTVANSVAGAMSISATGPNDERTFYSNYGTNEIDVGAPGGGYETLEKTLADDTEWPFPTNLVLSSVPHEIYAPPTPTSLARPWPRPRSRGRPVWSGPGTRTSERKRSSARSKTARTSSPAKATRTSARGDSTPPTRSTRRSP